MNSYITSIFAAGFFILIAAVISNAIKFEGGSNPQDPKKRKTWFWILAILNPVLFFVISFFALAPDPNNSQMAYDDYIESLPIAAAVGFVLYIVMGFVMSKIFKNGKIGNWFILIFTFLTLNGCASTPTKCECKKELDKTLNNQALTGKAEISELNKRCDEVYKYVEEYMYEKCD